MFGFTSASSTKSFSQCLCPRTRQFLGIRYVSHCSHAVSMGARRDTVRRAAKEFLEWRRWGAEMRCGEVRRATTRLARNQGDEAVCKAGTSTSLTSSLFESIHGTAAQVFKSLHHTRVDKTLQYLTLNASNVEVITEIANWFMPDGGSGDFV